MPLPTTKDVRDLLEGYGLDLMTTLTLSGSWNGTTAVVTGIDTTRLQPLYYVSGTGIPAGAQIATVDVLDPINGQITLDVVTTAPGVAAAVVVTYYCVVSDNWIRNRRDNRIIPWVESKTRQSLSGIKEVTEYYDGTGSPLMILRRRPIVELISISYTNVDSNLYYLTPSAMQVINDEGILKAKANFNESSYIPIFFRGDRNIRIKYTYGFTDCPADIAEAVTMILASEVLAHAGSKTGGGDIGLQSFNRGFGENGKWTHIRKDLAKGGYALLQKYITAGAS
jgi:hypothetical protein